MNNLNNEYCMLNKRKTKVKYSVVKKENFYTLKKKNTNLSYNRNY